MALQIWLQMPLHASAGVGVNVADIEADGWDGIMLFDSQCLVEDPYVMLALASAKTIRLGLGTGVTNPITRHPAVTACAIASIQVASRGRAVLGIGRGFSSLAYLNAPPSTLDILARHLEQLQAYLRGEGVSLDAAAHALTDMSRGDGRKAVSRPNESRLAWLDPALPKVPVDLAATGPKAIALGARLAERISFSVGADLDRVRWAVRTAHAAVREFDRKSPLSLGAYISCVPHPNIDIARHYAAADVAMHTRIAAMDIGQTAIPAHQRKTVAKIASSYDMNRHGRHGSQTKDLDPQFIDRSAVVGAPAQCIERLSALVRAGLDRLILMVVAPQKPETALAYDNLVKIVLPELRRVHGEPQP